MKSTLLPIFCLLLSFGAICQEYTPPFFQVGDQLEVLIDEDDRSYYPHIVEKGHTMYSLSRIFRVSIADLCTYNGIPDGAPISLGQVIRIPIPEASVFVGRSLKRLPTGLHIPMYYTTQPKDNLYRISRLYFPQPMEDLMERNGLTSTDLPLGQSLLVGWFSIPLSSAVHATTQVSGDVSTDTLEKVYSLPTGPAIDSSMITTDSLTAYPDDFNPSLLGTLTYHEEMECVKKKDVAYWDKSLYDNGSIFALHSSAALDSYISVYNTNTRRTVLVKVIGRIPYGTYTNDVNLVLSPQAAKQLGGLDRRFKVEVEYLRG